MLSRLYSVTPYLVENSHIELYVVEADIHVHVHVYSFTVLHTHYNFGNNPFLSTFYTCQCRRCVTDFPLF